MKPYSLAQRMFLIAALALLPAVAIVISDAITLREIRDREVHAQALRSAELASLEMERIFDGAESVLRVVAATRFVRQSEGSACSAFLSRTVDALPFLSSVAIIDPDGQVWCLSSQPAPTLYLGDRPYFQEALATSERVTGVFTVGRQSLRNILPVALRYSDDNGQVAGVVAAYIDLGWLQSTIEERSLELGSSMTLADRDGRILARTPNPEDFVGTVIPDAFQRLVNAVERGTEELVSQDGTRRIIGYSPAAARPRGIYISTGVSVNGAFAPIRQLATTGVWIAFFGLLAALLLAAYTSRIFIVRPFDRLIRTIDAWRRGDTAARSRMSADQGEIGCVGVALDTFMDKLLESHAAQQQAEADRHLLAKELDHRIKNLLTLIQVVARQTFAQADAKKAVATFSARLRAMAEANELLLADSWQAAPLQSLIENAVAPFQEEKAERFRIEGPDILLSSGATLAIGMALHELCTNAAKYGALSVPGGSVAITWSVSGALDARQFVLVWAERGGPPITPPSRTGFGSKVIKEVLEQKISGTVDLSYGPDGLICSITAPVAALSAPTPEHSHPTL